MVAMADAAGFSVSDSPPAEPWPDPDMRVLRLHRRPPPLFPLGVLGSGWEQWIRETAEAAACPVDYVVMPLLSATSVLIGNARWAEATPGWAEPPHLWCCVVGDSGDGKSPGADCILRDVLPELERRMQGDFPDRYREWQQAAERAKAAHESWKDEVRTAQKEGTPPPIAPDPAPPEPQAPRLRQNDVTIEKVATLLGSAAAPKGVLIVRDEKAGWLASMNHYNEAGRAFWIEAYGGRPYRVERQKHLLPIDVPHLAVAAYGGTQPEKLSELLAEADDGLFSRVIWAWPEPIPFRLGQRAPQAEWAIDALDRVRELNLAPTPMPGETDRPFHVKLVERAWPIMEEFGRDMQARQATTGGLMRSAFGKARGLALRLSLVLEMLWWAARDGMSAPPTVITEKAFLGAATLVAEYFMPMAERVYGDAGTSVADRNAATLAKWIVKEKITEVHVRHLQREVRLPGLKTAEDIHKAARVLVETDWLREPPAAAGKRTRMSYPVNPKVLEFIDGTVG
jgi:hypothetical protein